MMSLKHLELKDKNRKHMYLKYLSPEKILRLFLYMDFIMSKILHICNEIIRMTKGEKYELQRKSAKVNEILSFS